MIRYGFDWAVLEAAVDTRSVDWRSDARAVTEALREGAPVTVTLPSWSDVKPDFVERQFHKCCYCETRLERDPKAGIQFDVEHFRPKQQVREWRGSGDLVGADRGGSSDGYRYLAYDLKNYAAACKTCNTILKRCYFPIAGVRNASAASSSEARDERPYLIYPLGDDGDPEEDPERHITFVGPIAVPVDDSVRGKVMIALFDLNRDGLKFGRCERICVAWEAQSSAEVYAAPGAPHSACVQRFLALCRENPEAAKRHYDTARAWVSREYGHRVS